MTERDRLGVLVDALVAIVSGLVRDGDTQDDYALVAGDES